MNLIFRCYHCGKKNIVDKFCEENDFMPLSSHPYDNYWAGPGMYLWDNLSNAKWWYDGKSDKVNRKICKCMLHIDEEKLLDITDYSIAESMQQLIGLLENSEQIKATDEIGIKVSFIAERFGLQVVKLFGNYPKAKQSEFFNNPNRNKPHAAINSRVIYCVKQGNHNLLKNREIENGD